MSDQQDQRLPVGGSINRQKPLRFYFNHCSYQGYEGDTLASALLANGIHLVGRSMKFHRPRGILSAGAEECNALMRVGEAGRQLPNVRATMQPLYADLVAASQNCWPGVKFDIGAILDMTYGLWPAGFYNKTFIWPSWGWYENIIRHTAGLGTLPPEDDPDVYTQKNVNCDVLICGGGPTGLGAALAAGKAGARVLLVEQATEFGGSLLREKIFCNSDDSANWLKSTLGELQRMGNVTLLKRAVATGCFDHNFVTVSEQLDSSSSLSRVASRPRERLLKVRARQIILATGAIEQPLVFPNNDRPGIMLASAVREYLNRYGVKVGNKIVIVTNNDSAYATAFDLKSAGVVISCIVDARPAGSSTIAEQAIQQGITVYRNSILLNTKGRKRVTSILISAESVQASIAGAKEGRGRKTIKIACDAVAMSGGWQPAVHLFSQARGKLAFDEQIQAFVPSVTPAHIYAPGAVSGTVDTDDVLQEGWRCGELAAKALGFSVMQPGPPQIINIAKASLNVRRYNAVVKPAKQWLDFQHDVTVRDIDIAVQEGYTSIEHLKRYTTTGMSVDQGKTSNINALLTLAERINRPVNAVGTTTFRPFYVPMTLGAIAGRRKKEQYATTRLSPMHDDHCRAGAEFWDYGHWRRPAAFPRANEGFQKAMQREAVAVRRSVGIYDGSPLGKIEVRGPDAAEFLDRFYINNVHTLKVGRARYGIMLDEKGIVKDDGIFTRLSEEHFLIHTTSGNAEHILAWFEEWQQCEWSDLKVLIRSVTTQWANATISGPNARKVLEKLNASINLDNDNFPHMSIREGYIPHGDTEIPVRIMRASFTGELGYEINVPANYGMALWQNLLNAGREFDITRYGVESLMILRSEKGYLHVGADTDGTTAPDDIGWGGPIKKKQADFIGKRSLQLQDKQREDRLQYVGIELLNGAANNSPGQLITGSHVIDADCKGAPCKSRGYVTSAFFSPNLNCWVALGLVRKGRECIGDIINLYHNGKTQKARIVEPVFFDKLGERLHV